jgi:hypothetical protein
MKGGEREVGGQGKRRWGEVRRTRERLCDKGSCKAVIYRGSVWDDYPLH